MVPALRVMMALLERERTGQGQWVQSSLLQAQIAMLDFQAARWLIDAEVPGQAGNDHPTAVPMGVYPTSDGLMNIAVNGARMWRDFCTVISRPDLVEAPEYATPQARLANRAALNALLYDLTRTWTTRDLTEALLATGIPCGPINSIDAVFADPQVQHLPVVAEVDHPTRGRQRLVGQPIQIDGISPVMRSATPDCGQHTDEVLSELDYTPDQITALRNGGIA